MNKTILKSFASITMIAAVLLLAGCSKEEPKKEDTPELITKATLVFTPSDGSAAVTVTATDPDNQGAQPIRVDGPINLVKNKTYVMTISLINGLAQPTDAAYDVTEEVREEGIEHQFFFAWTNNIFSNPSGNGNIDNRTDAVLYEGGQNDTSKDANGRNLGLVTTWTTATSSISGGTFRVLLKHQPDNLKSDSSDSTTGETDLDLTFPINIQ